MNVIKVNMKDVPAQDFSKMSPVRKFTKNLVKKGLSLDSRIEFYRDVRPDEFDFAITNVGEYLNNDPRPDLK